MADHVFGVVLRIGLYGSILALALVLANCSVGNPTDLLSSRPAVPGPLGQGDATGTRNRLPHGGCDEKSGYTPTESLERLPTTQS